MRRLNDEGGAVAVLVAILMVVLLGFGALVLDIGSLYAERRQVQNGADAGALAIAYDCAKTGSCGAYPTTAQTYADRNANDGESNVAEVCGTGPGLPECTTPPTATEGAGFVRVRVRTGSDGMVGRMPPILGRVLDDTWTGETVEARALVAWGALAGSDQIFPLAFCLDRYNQFTNNNTTLGPPAATYLYKDPSGNVDCPTTDDLFPGGVGWLNIDRPTADFAVDLSACRITTRSDVWVPGAPGSGLPATANWTKCVDVLRAKIHEFASNPDATPLLVPIFDGWRNPGVNGELHIIGFGAFVPTGYHFGGAQNYPNNRVCQDDPNKNCIRGYFIDWVTSSGVLGPGSGYGLSTVQMVG